MHIVNSDPPKHDTVIYSDLYLGKMKDIHKHWRFKVQYHGIDWQGLRNVIKKWKNIAEDILKVGERLRHLCRKPHDWRRL